MTQPTWRLFFGADDSPCYLPPAFYLLMLHLLPNFLLPANYWFLLLESFLPALYLLLLLPLQDLMPPGLSQPKLLPFLLLPLRSVAPAALSMGGSLN